MYTCKETIELLTTADIRPLTLREKLGVKMHTMLCKICNAYNKQVKIIKRALQKHEISDVEAQQAVKNISKTLSANSEFLH
ncbi:MAG: hypothetical protein HQ472_06850 [Ignavibacteria bacterium]|nr:hypothetical protein [Ignavibacteria bacterium]